MTRAWAPVAAALALAWLAGLGAEAAGVPLPWLLGPLFATAVAAMADLRLGGAPLRLPKWVRPVCVPVIGVTIGSTVTPEIVGQAAAWWPSLLAVPPYVVVVQFLNYAMLRRIGRFDRPTAFFAASPGGLVDAVLSGESRGGALAAMSTQHFARIALTVATVPFLLSFAGAPGSGPPAGGDAVDGWPGFVDSGLLILCAALGSVLGLRLRLPAGIMLGPFVLSAALHLAGATAAGVPAAVVNLAQMAVGATLGLQFAGVGRRQVAHGLGLAVLAVALAMAVATALAFGLTGLVEAPTAAIFLAFAPGGLAEMSLIAVSLGVEPSYVAVHHILRLVLTISLAPVLFDRWIAQDVEGDPG